MKKIAISAICLILSIFLLTGCEIQPKESDQVQSDKLMKSIIEALENKDKKALKELFSKYAIENTDDLDEKIKELIEFYPGSDGGYTGNTAMHKTAERGDIIKVISTHYKVKDSSQDYKMTITTYVENDIDSDKIGLYSIEILTPGADHDGFKWRDEEDAPGIYIWDN